MRNISFDESLVLREFSRIANEQGLIKTAQDLPQPKGDVVQPAVPQSRPGPDMQRSTQVSPFSDQLRSFPTVLSLYTSGRVADGSALLGELGSPEFVRFFSGWRQSKDPAALQQLGKLVDSVSKVVAQLSAQIRQMPENFQLAYLPKIKQIQQLLMSKSASVKSAADKLYDVSGETGEDLVDQAHPGGGTKTELTHSKTDENLVETIVEQQEKDIEVALSMPKGTYAALLNLADRLDKLGYVRAADKVDALLKKKLI